MPWRLRLDSAFDGSHSNSIIHTLYVLIVVSQTHECRTGRRADGWSATATCQHLHARRPPRSRNHNELRRCKISKSME